MLFFAIYLLILDLQLDFKLFYLALKFYISKACNIIHCKSISFILTYLSGLFYQSYFIKSYVQNDIYFMDKKRLFYFGTFLSILTISFLIRPAYLHYYFSSKKTKSNRIILTKLLCKSF